MPQSSPLCTTWPSICTPACSAAVWSRRQGSGFRITAPHAEGGGYSKDAPPLCNYVPRSLCLLPTGLLHNSIFLLPLQSYSCPLLSQAHRPHIHACLHPMPHALHWGMVVPEHTCVTWSRPAACIVSARGCWEGSAPASNCRLAGITIFACACDRSMSRSLQAGGQQPASGVQTGGG